MGAINNQRVANYSDHVPLPPAAYDFCYRQRQNQRLFFENFVSSSIKQLPYFSTDLYKMAIIAVCKYINSGSFSFILLLDNLVPDNSSIVFRYIIETLLNMHGQTHLNMICPIAVDSEQRYRHTYDLEWCLDLYRHRTT
jgi:hypothetical protein